jgi:hypothetical protein
MDPISGILVGLGGLASGAGAVTQARSNTDCGAKPWFNKEKQAEWQKCVDKSLQLRTETLATQEKMLQQSQQTEAEAQKAKTRRTIIIGMAILVTVILVVVIVKRRKK